jgi:class 3 adenylate cyclase/alpha-beta hydrolase superfamily lysophospholipase
MTTTRPQTRYVTVGDADVAYQVLGQGPPDLLLLNSVTSHLELNWQLRDYADVFTRLASFSRLIMFDRRGSGASDPAPPNATWEEFTEDVRAVLDAAGSTKAAILGVIDATPIAILFAAMHPDRVVGLILLNGYARNLKGDDFPIGLTGEEHDAMMAGVSKLWGTPELSSLSTPSRADDTDFLDRVAEINRASATPRAIAEYFKRWRTIDVRHALPLIKVPTLLLHAPDNPFVSPDLGRYVADHIEGATFAELPGGDFGLMGDSARVVCDETAEFLTGHRPVEAERVLATVVFTDIADSTAKAASLGDRQWRSLLDMHDQVVRRELSRFRGREINTTGDGFFAAFDGPARAIRCTKAIIEATKTVGIAVRAGVHTGECEIRGEDLGGIAVHVGARVGALAQPGEVLVSRTVVDLVAGSGIEFADRGEHALKGVPGTWRLFGVVG